MIKYNLQIWLLLGMVLISCSWSTNKTHSLTYDEVVEVLLTDSLFQNDNYISSSKSRTNYIREYIRVDGNYARINYIDCLDWLYFYDNLDPMIKEEMELYYREVKKNRINRIRRKSEYSIYYSDLVDSNGLGINFLQIINDTLELNNIYFIDKVGGFNRVDECLFSYSVN